LKCLQTLNRFCQQKTQELRGTFMPRCCCSTTSYRTRTRLASLMPMTLDQLAQEALALPSESRALLADKLMESLDTAELDDIDRLWATEAKRRRDEVRTGTGTDDSWRRGFGASPPSPRPMRYEFHPEALAEYDEAAHYYAEQQADLGLRFIASVEHAISLILEAPTCWRIIDEDVRRCLTRVFPVWNTLHNRARLHSHRRNHALQPRTWILKKPNYSHALTRSRELRFRCGFPASSLLTD
jgi:hypothetical protein